MSQMRKIIIKKLLLITTNHQQKRHPRQMVLYKAKGRRMKARLRKPDKIQKMKKLNFRRSYQHRTLNRLKL